MNDATVHKLSVVDSDVVAGHNVLYCEGVADSHLLRGKTFKCMSVPLEVTLGNVSTCGSSSLVAFRYTGDRIPSGERLEFEQVE